MMVMIVTKMMTRMTQQSNRHRCRGAKEDRKQKPKKNKHTHRFDDWFEANP